LYSYTCEKKLLFSGNSSLELPSTYVWAASTVAMLEEKSRLTTAGADALLELIGHSAVLERNAFTRA